MYKKLKMNIALVGVSVLSGCSVNSFMDSANVCNIEDADFQYCHYIETEQNNEMAQEEEIVVPATMQGWQDPILPSNSGEMVHFKRLNEYAEQIAMKLVDTMAFKQAFGSVAITSFVNLDSSLNNTNAVGNQLSEYLLHEMRRFGVPVVDYKTTGSIKLTHNGDFVFSRQADEIESVQAIDYVLSGTFVFNARGVVINARVIGMQNKAVIASAKSFIPNMLISKS